MATYVLIHGGGSTAATWDLVSEELRRRGHETVAVELPCDNPSATWNDYADAIVNAIGDRTDLIVVAHSMGGFTAPLVCERVPAELLILVAGMVPVPGEAFMQWWEDTNYTQAKQEQAEREGRSPDATEDVYETYYLDVPRALADADLARGEVRENAPSEPLPLATWPEVPTRFLLCRDDRCFPAELMRRVVQERLGFTPDELPGSHMPMLARPKELADRLEAYRLGV